MPRDDGPPPRPNTDDLLADTRDLRAQLPWAVLVAYFSIDFFSLITGPWLVAWLAVAKGEATPLAAYGIAAVATYANFRFFLKQSPLFTDRGLRSVGEPR